MALDMACVVEEFLDDGNSSSFSDDDSFEDDHEAESVTEVSTNRYTTSRSALKESTNVTPTAAGYRNRSQLPPAKRLPFQSPKSEPCSKKKSVEGRLCEILNEVKETKGRIDEWDKKFSSIEQRLTMLESPVTSSSDDFSTPQKRKIPNHVRHLVRELYKTLLEDDENFPGFDLKKKYSEKENQVVVKKLIEEVHGQDATISLIHVKDSIRRFFLSKSEESVLKEKGIYDDKVLKQRRRNRTKKKLEVRKAALQRTKSLSEDKKAKWNEVLVHSFMSSEESGEEDCNGFMRSVLYVKKLSWRSDHVTRFFHQLDHKADKAKSKRGKQQTIPRVPSTCFSERPKPVTELGSHHWAFV